MTSSGTQPPVVFAAPWSTLLTAVSWFALCLLLGLVVLGLAVIPPRPPFARLVTIGVPIMILAVTLPFTVRAYRLSSDSLQIRRLGWTTNLPLQGLISVAEDRTALRGALRRFGNGGLFSFTGLYWSQRLGNFHAFATDPDRAVVLRFAARTVVITPDDPERFVASLTRHNAARPPQ